MVNGIEVAYKFQLTEFLAGCIEIGLCVAISSYLEGDLLFQCIGYLPVKSNENDYLKAFNYAFD